MIRTGLLDLRPLPVDAAAALPDDRETAADLLGARLSPEWPQPDLVEALPVFAAAEPKQEGFWAWVIIERAANAVVGDVGFVGPPGEDGTVEIGYSVVPARRGRGYASEAARAVVDWALGQPGVRSVVAGCDPDNVPSIRILERLGFARTGERDGHLRWRLDAPCEKEPSRAVGRRRRSTRTRSRRDSRS